MDEIELEIEIFELTPIMFYCEGIDQKTLELAYASIVIRGEDHAE